MNSEELEVSLRTEFENYLKTNLAEIKQEISQLQEKVNTELERHKSQLDEFFEVAQSNFEKEKELDPSFKDSVMEHLRLSRDEGAQITAKAFAQAEEMEKEEATQSVGIKEIFEAVSEISSKTTQSEILKTLVQHASQFTPRGAFFIIKNEHLVGWRVFGKEKGTADEKVREVFLPLSSNSVLSQSVKTLSTVSVSDGGFDDDKQVLHGLDFGDPQKMLAVPLIARGRGVAVLYADYGNEGGEVNAEALETLVKVAGLTVEVLASSKNTATKKSGKKSTASETEEESVSSNVEVAGNQTVIVEPSATYQPVAETTSAYQGFVSEPAVESGYRTSLDNSEAYSTPIVEEVEPAPNQFVANEYQIADDSQIDEVRVDDSTYQIEEEKYPAFETSSWSSESSVEEVSVEEVPEKVEDLTAAELVEQTEITQEFQATDFSSDFESFKTETQAEIEEALPSETVEVETEFSNQAEEESYPAFEADSWSAPTEATTTSFSAQEFAQNFAKENDPTEFAKDFSDQTDTYQPVETESFTTTTDEFVPTQEQTYGTFDLDSPKAETVEVSQPVATAPKSRLSERNVDLPIEVSEDERRLHNDARRFARLLVSEIKLYNEQKVKEGREASDLYERLKEAIDRSREMYDKRVQPAVASKFDYFHYELINTLAEGDDNKLGGSYPGSSI